MALEDVLELKNKKEIFEIKKGKLQQIIDICEEEENQLSDYDFYTIYSKAKFLIDVMKMEIHELEKHSRCNHNIVVKDLWVGNDSHYDHYVDKCSDCDKVINQYKI